MGQQGVSPAQICQVLNVSLQYVSKWKGQSEAGGAGALRGSHRGSEGYLREEEWHEISQWLGAQETVSVEAGRAYGEDRYGGVYHSNQSTYELREAGGRSYHRREKNNPQRDEGQVLVRREEIKKNWWPGGRRLSGKR